MGLGWGKGAAFRLVEVGAVDWEETGNGKSKSDSSYKGGPSTTGGTHRGLLIYLCDNGKSL